ncbi:hypothetical protein [Novosphingobium sp.]|uniref:hypothetical protein n=1 Tax=Novosphingobium sp. TaxID=1874826 RepID=UPI00286D6A32|nr:hypothetical protein [Novosphingobium sp.]
MSTPNEADFALIKMGDGGGTEVFTAICGIENVSINNAVQTSDRTRRDCAKPGKIGTRKIKATGKTQTITGSGGVDKANIASFDTALGLVKNYKVELYKYDGTDTGLLYGTYAGAYMMTSSNMSFDPNGDSSGEITLESDGSWTWTAAS